MKKYKLYTHKYWKKYSWESMNDSRYMEWDIHRCDHGDPHPPPAAHDKIFYTDSELEHATSHECKTKIAFMLEPRDIVPGFYNNLEMMIDTFDTVLTHNDALVNTYPEKCMFYPHGNCVIKRKDFKLYEKCKLVSFISSTKNMNVSGHRLRHIFYDVYTKRMANRWTRALIKDREVDMYGAIAHNFIRYKLESLKDYMFQIVVENCVVDTLFTEKIIDCFVTGTIPIYYGTKNIGHFFDLDGIIQFSTIKELLRILGELTPEAYSCRMNAVARNFQLAQQYVLPEDWIYEHTNVFD